MGNFSEGYQKRNINTNPVKKPLIYNAIMPEKYVMVMGTENLCKYAVKVYFDLRSILIPNTT